MYVSISLRFSGGARSWSVFLLAVLVTLASSDLLLKEDGSHLAYFCVEPDFESGEKENIPVIMLHGVMDIKETWSGISENISTTTHRKVCMYDARNHGGSSWNDTMTVDSMVEDLLIFMDKMKIDRAFLVGHSMGGQTIMKFTLTYPNKVAGIFIEDVGPDKEYILRVQDYMWLIVKFIYKSISAIPDGADETTAKSAIINSMVKIVREKPPDIYQKALPLQFINGVWQPKTNLKLIQKMTENNVNASSYFAKLDGQYEGKAVFIYGLASPFMVGNQEEDIRKLFPNAKIVAVERANHVIHWNYPKFMEELLDFLK